MDTAFPSAGSSQLRLPDSRLNQHAVTRRPYEEVILPKAQQALDLMQEARDAGEFDFLRVLTARRAYFDANVKIDTYEHAFYIDYQNRKADYVEKFLDHIDWNEVEARFRSA